MILETYMLNYFKEQILNQFPPISISASVLNFSILQSFSESYWKAGIKTILIIHGFLSEQANFNNILKV